MCVWGGGGGGGGGGRWGVAAASDSSAATGPFFQFDALPRDVSVHFQRPQLPKLECGFGSQTGFWLSGLSERHFLELVIKVPFSVKDSDQEINQKLNAISPLSKSVPQLPYRNTSLTIIVDYVIL